MLEVLIDDKQGNVYDVSDLVTRITITSRRVGRPTSATLNLIPKLDIEPGHVMRVRFGEWNAFYGYIFTAGARVGEMTVEAYDQTRYLLGKVTRIFTAKKASDIVREIASDHGLRIGKIEDTGYTIPSLIEDNQTALDIIQHALEETTQATGQLYVFGDVFGSIELWKPNTSIYETAITDDTVVVGYDTKRSIDQDTYNRVIVYRDNDETGKRETWVAQDSKNIAKWGRLTLTHKIDKKLGEAQIKQVLDTLIKLKNRETRSTTIRTLGLPKLRAGMLVRVQIDYEQTKIDGLFLTEEVKHDIAGGAHLSELKLAVPSGGGT